MHKKIVLLSFAFGFQFVLCRAASLPRKEFLAFDTRFTPLVPVKNNTTSQVEPEAFRVTVNAKPFFSPSKKTFLTLSLVYDNYHFNYAGWSHTGESLKIDTVHFIGIPIFFHYQMAAPQWTLLAFMNPGVSSDFKAEPLKGFNVQGGVIFDRAWEARHVGIGVVAINNFGQPRIFPAISYEQTIQGRHRIRVRAPTEVSYYYRVNEGLEVGALTKTQGINARIEEEGPYQDKYLSYSLSTIGPSVWWAVSKKIALTIDSGWIYRHKLDINSGRNEFRNFDLQESAFLSAGVKISL